MTSLPGDPRKPRPFRVDEDGEVVYRDDQSPDAERLAGIKPHDLAQAGILDWGELDRNIDKRLSLLAGRNAEPLASPSLPPEAPGGRRPVSLSRKTIGGTEYYVISANSFDPTRSNGKTVMPNADVIAAMNASMGQIAVTDGGPEKTNSIVRLPLDFTENDTGPVGERNLPLINPKPEMYYSVPAVDVKVKSIGNADTARFRPAFGAVAAGHGHRDGISDGMIDEWNPAIGLYGDIESLRSDYPMPMATVSEGRIGWHQLNNGRVQFMYPVGSYLTRDRERIICDGGFKKIWIVSRNFSKVEAEMNIVSLF
jgi:hypothetical protein